MFEAVSWKLLAITTVLLFIGIAPLPYSYYTFMRVIVCGCAGYMAYQGVKEEDKSFWPWIFGFVAILFNPVAVIHMTKEIWMVVDGLTGCLFAWLALRAYKQQN
tara:strand:- start:1201 stop:1512 length:312 start_codon:yes stop_codon:yes gene_type:complete